MPEASSYVEAGYEWPPAYDQNAIDVARGMMHSVTTDPRFDALISQLPDDVVMEIVGCSLMRSVSKT